MSKLRRGPIVCLAGLSLAAVVAVAILQRQWIVEHWTDSAVLEALHDLGDPAREAVEQAAASTDLALFGELLQAMRNDRLRYDKDLPRKRMTLESTFFE